MKFGLVIVIFPNLVANDYKSHVVVNGLVTFWLISTSETSSYASHICGLNGHKKINCPKFAEMQQMFHGKFGTTIELLLKYKQSL